MATLEELVDYWFDKTLEDEVCPKELESALLQQKERIKKKVSNLPKNFSLKEFMDALQIEIPGEERGTIPCIWDTLAFKFCKGKGWSWELSPLRGLYATYRLAHAEKESYQKLRDCCDNLRRNENAARNFWERKVKGSKELKEEILHNFKKAFRKASRKKIIWRYIGLPYNIRTATHFYMEGVRFYVDPIQQANVDTFFVHATTSGILNPEEYYGLLYDIVGQYEKIPSWAEPGSFTLDLYSTEVSEDEIDKLECFEQWSRALVENVDILLDKRKNPARKFYFDSGIANGKSHVSYLFTRKTFSGYSAQKKVLWRTLFDFFKKKAGVQLYLLNSDGFVDEFEDLHHWTLFGTRGDTLSGMVLKSERDPEARKISHGLSFLVNSVLVEKMEELMEFVLKIGINLAPLFVTLSIDDPRKRIIALIFNIVVTLEETAKRLKELREQVREKCETIKNLALEARKEATQIENWEQLEAVATLS